MLWLKEIAEELGTTEYGCVTPCEPHIIYCSILTVLCVFTFTSSSAPLSREGRLAELFPAGKALDLAGVLEFPSSKKALPCAPTKPFGSFRI